MGLQLGWCNYYEECFDLTLAMHGILFVTRIYNHVQAMMTLLHVQGRNNAMRSVPVRSRTYIVCCAPAKRLIKPMTWVRLSL
jgi:hypothetical protein